jgi:hypothetical protein
MRMNYKNFSVIILCVIFAYLSTIALVNIVVDPFYIFRTPFLKLQAQINDRYAKIEHLKKQKTKFNLFILGSSRTYYTHPRTLEKYIPSGKGYNLATIMANVTEHLLHVRYLIKNGHPVKTLYIGLDIDFCFGIKTHKDQDYLLKLHPDVSDTNPIDFYWSYLSIFPKGDIKRKLKANFRKKGTPKVRFGEDGAVEPEAENSQIFFDNQRKLKDTIRDKMSRENLKVLRELVTLCKQNNINLIIFITPHHRTIIDHFLEEDYIAFLKGLSEVTSFWNFSGYNSITTDNKNYFSLSHYVPSVSRLIAARIFDDKTLDVPKDFGVWVTKDNIDAHLKNLKESFKKQYPKK